ncbi:hypothetical protein EGM51_01770 [Verrucomicrobia bacterium S94]|nr:hypothetical protein EGM51_01770 [Verrucomicrobia bacterium S94]
MPNQTIGKTKIAPVSPGSLFSYELYGDYLIRRFLGLLPVTRVHLGAVRYLRLATRNEISLSNMLLNGLQLMNRQRSKHPVYILHTRKGRKMFLKLESGSHFRLRQAIARHSDRRVHKMAA